LEGRWASAMSICAWTDLLSQPLAISLIVLSATADGKGGEVGDLPLRASALAVNQTGAIV
jgi:hypothetical protein